MPTAGDRISEYVLEAPVGRGAFGEVWRARHHVWTDQRVAIKFPADPQYLRQLQREGLVAAGLEHPNVVRPLGFDPYASPPYLVMEYVEGTNLRNAIAGGAMPVDEAIDVVRQMLAALDHAHGRGIVHRDLKPENVLLASPAEPAGAPGPRRRLVKLTDFALARPEATAAGSIVFSRSFDSPEAREIVGSLDYMSPEQRAGLPVDARTDLYAVGVILHEMLTGERPAGAEVPGSLNPAVPAWVDELFRRAYARLDRRFASAGEMLRFIDQHAGGRAPAGGATVPRPLPLPAVPPPGGGPTPSICPQCRHPVQADDQFCIHCGVQLVREVRRCRDCGGYPAADDDFCSFCGAALRAAVTG